MNRTGSQTSTIGTPVNLQIHATDTDNGTLTYSASGLPAGLSINPTTGLITGTPTSISKAGATVTAKDVSGPANTVTFMWSVLAPAAIPVVQISAGAWTDCAVLSNGNVYCWGINNAGQLGDGTTSGPTICTPNSPAACSLTAVQVSGISDAKQVAVGNGFACALLSTGHIVCWGYNGDGELGDGGNESESDVPVPVSTITNATSISAGNSQVCAVLAGGSVDCWGQNGSGEVGVGDYAERSTPAPVLNLDDVTSVAGGTYFTCALLASSSIDCWGAGYLGQLADGNGSDGSGSGSPIPQAASVPDASAIATGGGNGCAVVAQGAVDCWGQSIEGALGDGGATAPDNCFGSPCATSGSQVAQLPAATSVAAGSSFECALLSTGAVMCWGEDGSGELGNGSIPTSGYLTLPAYVGLTGPATAVSASEADACALLQTGEVQCWGDDRYGLGDGSGGQQTDYSATPVTVAGIP